MLRIVPKILKDHRGFTIVESVIAGAVAVVVLGGFMGSIAAMSSIQKKTDLASEAMNLETELSETIKAGDACTAAFSGKNVTAGGALTLNMQIGGTFQNVTVGSEPIQGVRIRQLQLVLNTNIPASSPVPSAILGNLTERIAVVRMQTEKTVNGVTELGPVTDIPMKVMLTAGNAIAYCNPDANQERVCAQQGGVWDKNANKCTPTNHCEFAGSFSRAPFNQGGYVNEFTGDLRCKDGFDTVRSGSVAVASTCGKNCVANNYYDVYSCVQCGSAFTIRPSGATQLGQVLVPGLEGEIRQAKRDVENQSDEIGAVGTPVPTPTPVPPDICTAANQGSQNPAGDATCMCYNAGQYGSGCFWAPNPTPTPQPTATPTPWPTTCTWANNGNYSANGMRLCTCTDQNTCYWENVGGGGGGGGCFLAGTQISMADGSKKAIEKVAIGDRVLSYNEDTGQPYFSSVVNTLHHAAQVQRIYEVYTEDGHYFAANGVHVIYTTEDRDYVPMQVLYDRYKAKKTVTFISERGKKQRISAIRVRDEVVPVYNLHVDGISEKGGYHGGGVGHNYFSGGILVHNLQVNKQ